MPSSNLSLAPAIVAMAAEVGPRRVLDVGPGFGKYGVLMREYLAPVLDELDAVEVEPRYRERFPWTAAIYDHVYEIDVAKVGVTSGLTASKGLTDYDLVLMIDVLEHLDHDEGEALLALIPGRVIVCTPRDFFQNPEADEGWETERHRSVWTVDELAALRFLEVVDQDALAIGGVLVRTGPLNS